MGKLLRALTTFGALYLLFSGGRVALVSAQQEGAGGEPTQQESQLIDIRANLVYPHKINDTTSVLCLVGDFAAQHNGAVITADSAVRYSDDRLECYGNVLINQNTTYAYAERAKYDGESNLATLYSDLVKVVDEDVTLYTYHFEFNTEDNIGRYWGGGVTIKRPADGDTIEDVMESQRGYYHADEKRVVGVKDVEASGSGYLMSGDSIIYDMDIEQLYFFHNTHIWSQERDYLYGDKGIYNKIEKHYYITRNSYLLRPEQEVWCDTMEYFEPREEIILRNNLQLDDTTNRTLAFGDYGHYWGDTEQLLLTKEPTMLNYDTEQSDSLFLRADTIMAVSFALGTGPAFDMSGGDDAMAEALRKLKEWEESQKVAADTTALAEPVVDSVAEREPTVEQEMEQEGLLDTLMASKSHREIRREAKDAERAARIKSRARAEMAKERSQLIKRRAKVSQRVDKSLSKGRSIYSDSMVMISLSSAIEAVSDSLYADSLGYEALWLRDSVKRAMEALEMGYALDTLTIEQQLAVERELPAERDSLYRVVKAFRNVRSYRIDMQMICDSMTSISYDTVTRLYTRPILWSDQHQIVAKERTDIFTRDGNLDYADFIGDPIMGSQVVPHDTVHFNQVKGKSMRAYFEDNEIVRNDVDKNVETLYYMQDEQTKEPNTLAQIESGSASFLIKNRELDGVVYRTDPVYVFAPLDMLPSDMSLYLEEFKWMDDIRPTRADIFDGTIRPTQRAEVESLVQPQFDIREEIDNDRVRFERLGVWSDRIEHLHPDIVEWMRDLGYTPEQPRDNER